MKNHIDASRLAALKEKFPSIEYDENDEQHIVNVPADALIDVLTFLRDDDAFIFDRLENVTSVDYKTYFEMVYHLFSWNQHPIETDIERSNEYRDMWLTLKVRIDDHDNPSVPSVTSVFPGAEYEEREVYDLMGITFKGHPDLRRILLADDFTGHPLRKDYVEIAPPYTPRVRRKERRGADE